MQFNPANQGSAFLQGTRPQPYLEGNFAPVEDEITTGDLPVIGELPNELSGLFVRNGPNPRWAPIGRYHWFDGDGMLHGVRIQNGGASYLNRYVRTVGLGLEDAAGRALWTSLMDPIQTDVPEQSTFIRWKKNVANTALTWHAGRLLALWDTGEPYAISVPDLGTIGPVTFDGKLTFPVASHSKVDATTGELLLLGNVMRSRAAVHIGVVSPAGALDHVTTVDLPRAVYMHDFAITDRYVVIYDLPLTYSLERSKCGESPYLFEPNLHCRFGLVPRHGEGVRWFDIAPCYISHTMNAYEEDGQLVVVALRMASFALGHDAGPIYSNPPRLHRWRMDLKTGAVQEEPLCSLPVEFAIASPDRVGRKARYGYAVRLVSGGAPLMDALVKFDLAEGTTSVHELSSKANANCYCGDAEFVSRIDATGEDDGWLLFFTYNETENRSELVVLDARDVTAPPVARVLLPRRVPHGVHSVWVPL